VPSALIWPERLVDRLQQFGLALGDHHAGIIGIGLRAPRSSPAHRACCFLKSKNDRLSLMVASARPLDHQRDRLVETVGADDLGPAGLRQAAEIAGATAPTSCP
jgi:hypothetical protein